MKASINIENRHYFTEIKKQKINYFLGMLFILFICVSGAKASDSIDPSINFAGILPLSLILLPLIGIVLYLWTKKFENKIKDIVTIIFTILSLIHILFMVKYVFNPIDVQGKFYQGLFLSYRYMPNFDISLRVDKISMVILIIAGIFWAGVSIFVMQKNKSGLEKYRDYNLYVLIALFLNFGILMAGDFLTLFIFYEAMTVFPYFALIYRKAEIVAHEEKRFLLVEVITGISLLLALILFYFFTNTLEIKDMVNYFTTQIPPLWSAIISVLMVIGFGGKASLFFQHLVPSKTSANMLLPVPGSFIFSAVLFQIAAYSIFRYVTISLYGI